MKEKYRKPKASDTIDFTQTGSDYDLDSKKLNDHINHPAHYTQGGIKCIDAIDDVVLFRL